MKLKEIGHINAVEYRIIVGQVYVYTRDLPKGCKGGQYLVHGFILDEPSHQEKVLVECLSGKDTGMWFCCSPANFSYRYEPLEPPEERTPSNHSTRPAQPPAGREIVIQEGMGA